MNDHHKEAVTPAAAAANESESAQPNSVLVVEDSAVYRNMLASCLREWGYDVSVAEDGLQAWEMVQNGNMPNLLLIDWMLPGLDGIELCRRIRNRQTEPYPYVLLLSAQEKKQNLIDGLNAGADDYLTKPFDVNELRARLRSGTRILSLQGQLRRKEDELRFQALHDRVVEPRRDPGVSGKGAGSRTARPGASGRHGDRRGPFQSRQRHP